MAEQAKYNGMKVSLFSGSSAYGRSERMIPAGLLYLHKKVKAFQFTRGAALNLDGMDLSIHYREIIHLGGAAF